MEGEITSPQKGKSSKVKQTFDKVLERARSMFKTQFDRSVETKRAAIYRALNLQEASYTASKFFTEYVVRVGYLLDSKSFIRRCNDLEKEPYTIATHIAFEGMSKSRRAVEHGLGEFKNSFAEWTEPLFPLRPMDNVKGLADYDQEHLLDGVAEIKKLNVTSASVSQK